MKTYSSKAKNIATSNYSNINKDNLENETFVRSCDTPIQLLEEEMEPL